MNWLVGDLVWAPRSAVAWGAAEVIEVRVSDVVRVEFETGKPIEGNRRGVLCVARDPAEGGADRPEDIPVVWSGMRIGYGKERQRHE